MADSNKISGKILARSLDDAGTHMFIPEHFDFSEHKEIISYVQAHPFAHLFSSFNDLLQVTATPLIYIGQQEQGGATTRSKTQYEFIGHIAKRNPHCEAIHAGAHAIALLQGPDAYVSPRWYTMEPKIPTWSYVAVQLRGQFSAITDHQQTLEVLAKTIDHMERDNDNPWHIDKTDPSLLEQFSQGVLAFRFTVSEMEGIERLGQSRDLTDLEGVIKGLNKTQEPNAQTIAKMMQDKIDRAS
ncbi:protease synthase and sporulation protein PAI 2 [Arenicella chitinivorans]|uniref:Protease synthase and sporulation protein PAI 2 n=1 Tax=Arenicella chitinivorans TaxID=1329800 RepID=A0A918RJZ0_9GAMM|nr:FMN-binding negative transcriptional regulator [Arenicella chitinivorans]GGZ97840.1 protease synthase and sporulation protein PAI 2 [Arenicella chitinivorans]